MILEQLKQAIGIEKVLTGDDLRSRYVHIWKMDEPLRALCVVLPESTEDVSAIMTICHEHSQSVVVHGGLTNLVGGTETTGDEVVIAMERMKTIEEVDAQSRTMTVQSGVILQHIHEAATRESLTFPLNFGAKGSAQIGGIISTNAGGLRVFKYGMTRNLILGIEAVLADGTVISSMKKIIKDNSGYDLKQLFVGSEGTLGIVTKAVLKLVEEPKSRCSAMLAFDDYDKVVQFLKYIDGGLGGLLSGFELMWNNYYTTVTSPPALTKPPLPQTYAYYVLIETLGSDQASDSEKVTSLVQQAFEDERILDAVIADNQADLDWFWKIREDVHAAVSQFQYDQHFDISLPIPLIGSTLEAIVANLEEVVGVDQVVTFGHVADGNIHIMVGKSSPSDALKIAINEIVYSPLTAIGGSISAEHGIGLDKKSYLHICRNEAEIALMKQVKQAMDPKGLLNPGRIF